MNLNMNTDLHASGRVTTSYAVVERSGQFGKVLLPQFNLLVWRRELSPAVRAWVQRTAQVVAREVRASVGVDGRGVLALLREFSNDDAAPQDHAPMLADLTLLIEKFAKLAATKQVAARLAVVTSDKCQKFHADYKPLRLLCTYAGLGTEWVDDADADRSIFGQELPTIACANERIVKDVRKVQHARAGDVVLLKGEHFDGNQGRGAVHRSPNIQDAGLSRIVLTLDLE